jgi:hypothetical protein
MKENNDAIAKVNGFSQLSSTQKVEIETLKKDIKYYEIKV